MSDLNIYKVIICGDRKLREGYPTLVRFVIRRLVRQHGTTDLLIITGGAPGVDTLAKEIGNSLNVHVAVVDALWKSRGNGAGPQRNTIMRKLDPDEVVGIHIDFEKSKGTIDMLRQADRFGISTSRYSPR